MKFNRDFVPVKFFQVVLNSEGIVLHTNEELTSILVELGMKDNLKMSDLFPEIALRFLFKNQMTNYLKAIPALAESGYIEILKIKRTQANAWEMLFTPADKEAIEGNLLDINIEVILYFLNFFPHPIFIKNSKGVYRYINKAFAVFFGISNTKLKDMTDKDFVTDKDELELIMSTDRNIIKTGDDIEIPEYIHKNSEGKKSSLFVLKMAYGKTEETRIILGMGIDTTARRKNKKELEKTSYELENFIYKTSHNLMSPIKTLKGLSNIAKLDFVSFYENCLYNKFDEVIYSLEDYIKEVIDFTDNRTTAISLNNVNVRNLIENSFKKANDRIQNDEITLCIHMDDAIHVCVDEMRIANVLYILFCNAIQYSKPGKQFVNVYTMMTKDNLIIVVEDSGIGIIKELLPKVFDMYYRASTYSKGSGLGLYNVKEIIDKLDGKVEIESEEGIGTKVKLDIPCIIHTIHNVEQL